MTKKFKVNNFFLIYVWKSLLKNLKFRLPKGGKDVRPSDEEILEKKLPANTPSLKHRIMRDYEHKFYEEDKDGGYHKVSVNKLWMFCENEEKFFKNFIFREN